MGGPNMGESANNDRVVFPQDFTAKAKEIYPDDANLHVAIANGDYRTVKSILYNYSSRGHGMTASMLSTLPLDEIRSRAKIACDHDDMYYTCTDILNRYWNTTK